MKLPYEWRIGWRYTRAGRRARKNGFISFISGVSVVGIALGVAALMSVALLNAYYIGRLGSAELAAVSTEPSPSAPDGIVTSTCTATCARPRISAARASARRSPSVAAQSPLIAGSAAAASMAARIA